ncbi:hypothetical protein ACET3Z_028649 [Daucus carota]
MESGAPLEAVGAVEIIHESEYATSLPLSTFAQLNSISAIEAKTILRYEENSCYTQMISGLDYTTKR